MYEQLDLFELKPVTEMDIVWKRIEELKDSNDKLRKRMFKELKELQVELLELKSENERLKAKVYILEYKNEDGPRYEWKQQASN